MKSVNEQLWLELEYMGHLGEGPMGVGHVQEKEEEIQKLIFYHVLRHSQFSEQNSEPKG